MRAIIVILLSVTLSVFLFYSVEDDPLPHKLLLTFDAPIAEVQRCIRRNNTRTVAGLEGVETYEIIPMQRIRALRYEPPGATYYSNDGSIKITLLPGSNRNELMVRSSKPLTPDHAAIFQKCGDAGASGSAPDATVSLP